MKENKEKIIGIAISIAVILLLVGFRTFNEPKTGNNLPAPTEITKEEYINKLRQSGYNDPVSICTYEKLIDRYGVKYVRKLDLELTLDKEKIDEYPELIDVYRECIE